MERERRRGEREGGKIREEKGRREGGSEREERRGDMEVEQIQKLLKRVAECERQGRVGATEDATTAEEVLRKLRNDVIGNSSMKEKWIRDGAVQVVIDALKQLWEPCVFCQSPQLLKLQNIMEHCLVSLGSFIFSDAAKHIVIKNGGVHVLIWLTLYNIEDVDQSSVSCNVFSDSIRLKAVRALQNLLRDKISLSLLFEQFGKEPTSKSDDMANEDYLSSLDDLISDDPKLVSRALDSSIIRDPETAEFAALFIAIFCSNPHASSNDELKRRQQIILDHGGVQCLSNMLIRCLKLLDFDTKKLKKIRFSTDPVTRYTLYYDNHSYPKPNVPTDVYNYRWMESTLYAIERLTCDNYEASIAFMRCNVQASTEADNQIDDTMNNTLEILKRLSKSFNNNFKSLYNPSSGLYNYDSNWRNEKTSSSTVDGLSDTYKEDDGFRRRRNVKREKDTFSWEIKNKINLLSCMCLANIVGTQLKHRTHLKNSTTRDLRNWELLQPQKQAIGSEVEDAKIRNHYNCTVRNDARREECGLNSDKHPPSQNLEFDGEATLVELIPKAIAIIESQLTPQSKYLRLHDLEQNILRFKAQVELMACAPLLFRKIVETTTKVQDASCTVPGTVHKLGLLLDRLVKGITYTQRLLHTQKKLCSDVDKGALHKDRHYYTRNHLLSVQEFQAHALENTLLCLAAVCSHHDYIRQLLVETRCLKMVAAMIGELGSSYKGNHVRPPLRVISATISVIQSMSRSVRHLRTSFSPSATPTNYSIFDREDGRDKKSYDITGSIDGVREIASPLLQIIGKISSEDGDESIKTKVIALKTVSHFVLPFYPKKAEVLELGIIEMMTALLLKPDNSSQTHDVLRTHALNVLTNAVYCSSFSERNNILSQLVACGKFTSSTAPSCSEKEEVSTNVQNCILKLLVDPNREIGVLTMNMLSNIMNAYQKNDCDHMNVSNEQENVDTLLSLCGGVQDLIDCMHNNILNLTTVEARANTNSDKQSLKQSIHGTLMVLSNITAGPGVRDSTRDLICDSGILNSIIIGLEMSGSLNFGDGTLGRASDSNDTSPEEWRASLCCLVSNLLITSLSSDVQHNEHHLDNRDTMLYRRVNVLLDFRFRLKEGRRKKLYNIKTVLEEIATIDNVDVKYSAENALKELRTYSPSSSGERVRGI